jgi:hypothetical protein
MISAGPDTNAVAIKRGASNAMFQKGRAELAANRKAVTVWMEMAQNIASTTKGK